MDLVLALVCSRRHGCPETRLDCCCCSEARLSRRSAASCRIDHCWARHARCLVHLRVRDGSSSGRGAADLAVDPLERLRGLTTAVEEPESGAGKRKDQRTTRTDRRNRSLSLPLRLREQRAAPAATHTRCSSFAQQISVHFGLLLSRVAPRAVCRLATTGELQSPSPSFAAGRRGRATRAGVRRRPPPGRAARMAGGRCRIEGVLPSGISRDPRPIATYRNGRRASSGVSSPGCEHGSPRPRHDRV
jgi:hypothetical protein